MGKNPHAMFEDLGRTPFSTGFRPESYTAAAGVIQKSCCPKRQLGIRKPALGDPIH
jgi:hypothetical protein